MITVQNNITKEELKQHIDLVKSMTGQEKKYLKENIFSIIKQNKEDIKTLRKERDYALERGTSNTEIEYCNRLYEEYNKEKDLEMTLFALIYTHILPRKECEKHRLYPTMSINVFYREMNSPNRIIEHDKKKNMTTIIGQHEKLFIKTDKKKAS